jgi:hypothetical protein
LWAGRGADNWTAGSSPARTSHSVDSRPMEIQLAMVVLEVRDLDASIAFYDVSD